MNDKTLINTWENLSPRQILDESAQAFGEKHLAFACSFSVEDVMTLDLIQKNHPQIEVFTLDTGRLPEETYRLWEELLQHYPGLKIRPYFPDAKEMEDFIYAHGPNAFFKSIENRKACCGIRKISGLKRAIRDKKAWITGLRREQSQARGKLEIIEKDAFYPEKWKISPLAKVTSAEVWKYTEANNLPKNKLYEKGYTSIGCAPCTRAVREGEHERAGRWWWEESEKKECGLHPEFYAKKEEESTSSFVQETTERNENKRTTDFKDPASELQKHLDRLESESIFILREAYKKLGKIAMLWSIGKDSCVMLHLLRKAFFGHIPIPLVHIDTSFKMPEMIEFRDRYAKQWGLQLIIRKNESALKSGMNHKRGRMTCCKALKADPLKKLVEDEKLHGLIAGIRRDEEGSRSKERYFSPRGKNAEWNYKDQPPEFWDQFQVDFGPNTHIRIHPILHWTEIDVWEYIRQENIPVVDLYFAKNGKRYRSLGCAPCTDPIDSTAKTLDEIILELQNSQTSERSSRAQDRENAHALQRLRSEGYM